MSYTHTVKPSNSQIEDYLKKSFRDYHTYKVFKSKEFRNKVVPIGFDAEIRQAFKIIRVVKKEKNLIILDGLLNNMLHVSTYKSLHTGVDVSIKKETLKLLESELLTPDCKDKTLIKYLKELYPESNFKMERETKGRATLDKLVIDLIKRNRERGLRQTEVASFLGISISSVQRHWKD